MAGSVGGVSFDHNLTWLTFPSPTVMGSVKRGLDGTVIAIMLASPPDPIIGLHKFRFVWETLATVEALRDLADAGAKVTINCGDGTGNMQGFFPPGADVSANQQPSIGENEECGIADNEGTDLDIFNGEFDFFITDP